MVWHPARVQNHHVAELIDEDQLWVDGDWVRRFGLDPDPPVTLGVRLISIADDSLQHAEQAAYMRGLLKI